MTCRKSPELIDACIEGNIDQARALVAADPAAVNRKASFIDSTPLIFASHRGHLAIVDLLLDHGADIHAREGASDTTAVHWAAEGGHPLVIDRLLDAGAERDARDAWYGLTPPAWASYVTWASARHADRNGAFAALVAHGAPTDAFAWIARGDASRLEALLEAAPSEATRALGDVVGGDRPLHVAARRGEIACVEALARRGAPLDSTNALGETPLAVATPDAATRLTALGAPVDVSTRLARGEIDAIVDLRPEDATRLLCATAQRGDARAVKLLLDRGADPNATGPELLSELPSESTALHRAAKKGFVEVARILLAAGANPNARAPRTDLTPLHRAAANGHVEVVEVLLVHGADPAAKDLQHRATPSGWAEYARHSEVVAALARKA